MESFIDKIVEVINLRFQEEDLQDCFLIDIVHNGRKLEVFIDTDEGVSFKKCQRLSRAIEAYLDESLLLGPDYILEVSSPGVSRPLKYKRQYPRNIGRQIEIKLKYGTTLTGKFKSMDNDTLIIEEKKSKKDIVEHEISFDDIESSKIVIAF